MPWAAAAGNSGACPADSCVVLPGASHCSQAAHTSFLKPAGDDLRYTSDDPAAGDPSARPSKTD